MKRRPTNEAAGACMRTLSEANNIPHRDSIGTAVIATSCAMQELIFEFGEKFFWYVSWNATSDRLVEKRRAGQIIVRRRIDDKVKPENLRKWSHVRRIRNIARLVTFHYSPRGNYPATYDEHPARVRARRGDFSSRQAARHKRPGLIFLIPIVDRMVRMHLRVVTIDVARQEVMTRDNVPMTVDAVVYFRVIDAASAVVRVENYLKATSLISQTTLRSVLGQAELDELLSQRDKINLRLQEIIDRQTDPWGIKVTAVEVRDVILPDSMKRAMAGQAESERERRAKIINAEAEFQAAQKLVQAASMISAQPIALQLRFLQTMKEISSEHKTTTILPLPIYLRLGRSTKGPKAQPPKEP